MIRVSVTKDAGHLVAGRTYELDDASAESLVESGAVVPFSEPTPEPDEALPPVDSKSGRTRG
jgi:hypothetical protein